MAGEKDLGFHHVWAPGESDGGATLLLLHGTGADENDLVPLARRLAPGASLLSPRGKVVENGMPRWFARHGPGVLDVPDLKARAGELADFVARAAEAYGFDAERVLAVGFSNGANVATGLLLERPEAIAGGVLMRAMVPYAPDAPPRVEGKEVLILAGERDPYSHREVSERLAAILREGGARVDVHYEPAGHQLTQGDLAAARRWLQERLD